MKVEIHCSDDVSVAWRENKLDGEQSIVGALQINKDKSHILLIAGALDICLIPGTQLNSTERCRRPHISTGR